MPSGNTSSQGDTSWKVERQHYPASHPLDMCPQDTPMECSGTYTVKQTDVDSGLLENTFTVSASSPDLPDEPDVGGSESTTVALPGTPLATIGEQFV